MTGYGETFTVQDLDRFKDRLLLYLADKPVFCLLDSNQYYAQKELQGHPLFHNYDLLCAIGSTALLKCGHGNAFEALETFKAEHPEDWLFGYFGYDLKNEIEDLESKNQDCLGFDDLCFFVPETVIRTRGTEVIIEGDTDAALSFLFGHEDDVSDTGNGQNIEKQSNVIFKERITKEYYLETVEKLRQHIIEGDVYEVSFCQEFFAENTSISPFDVYRSLCETSPQPFGGFMRTDERYILCASMERYLNKSGIKLVSQPIKGTIKRGKNAKEDAILRDKLLYDEKERAENVMIVDLVRNDLSRVCQAGSVGVEELFGIYDFAGVFQMISTVTGELLHNKTGLDAIKASFPMGSMTGAPKIMAMQLIEQYEQSKRGVYSGAVGYFAPNGNFDFNVVIRTLLYNAASKYLSLHVGSAITYDSDPEKEYQECLVKIKTIIKAFENIA